MQVQILSGVRSTEGGSGGRARPISVLLAGSTPARCTNFEVDFGSLAERICSRLLSGEIQVQPLGDLPNFSNLWVVSSVVEQPPLKRKCIGSTPIQPTKCLCDAIGRHRLLKPSVLQVRLLSGVLAEMELWCALRSHKPSRTGFKSRLRYQC